MQTFAFSPIGVLRTPFIEKFGTPRQGHLVSSAPASLEFSTSAPAEAWLSGLEGFSHCWLITVFHENLNSNPPPKIHPPRLAGKSVGVLASRSPHRPNPIGLTLAKIEGIRGREIHLSGVDLLDGTPVLDIKPYLEEADSAKNAEMGWVANAPWPKTEVRIHADAVENLKDIYRTKPPPIDQVHFLRLAQETLSNDPRAVADREKNTRDGDLRWFWIRLYDVDCGFVFIPEGIEIRKIRPALLLK